MGDAAQYMVRLPDGSEFGPAGMDLVVRWAGEGRVPASALLVPADGGPVRSVLTEPMLMQMLQRPAMPPPAPYAGHRVGEPTTAFANTASASSAAQHGQMAAPPAGDDGIAVVIPYRNPHALFAYYLGLFAWIPVFGVILAPAALVLGVMGRRRRKANPLLRGNVHAWVGIIGGCFGLLVQGGCGFAIVMGMIESAKHGH